MHKVNPQLRFFMAMAKAQAILARRFDGRLGVFHGLGFNDFIILHHLSEEAGEKMRRTDLAERLGLTASGITRLLAPMEKIGLIRRETDGQDGRVSYVALAAGGKRLFQETLEDANGLSEDILAAHSAKKVEAASEVISALA